MQLSNFNLILAYHGSKLPALKVNLCLERLKEQNMRLSRLEHLQPSGLSDLQKECDRLIQAFEALAAPGDELATNNEYHSMLRASPAPSNLASRNPFLLERK